MFFLLIYEFRYIQKNRIRFTEEFYYFCQYSCIPMILCIDSWVNPWWFFFFSDISLICISLIWKHIPIDLEEKLRKNWFEKKKPTRTRSNIKHRSLLPCYDLITAMLVLHFYKITIALLTSCHLLVYQLCYPSCA